MLRGIVIDDELSGIDTIRLMAQRCPELIRIVATANDPSEGIGIVEDYKPDVLFLDISMPYLNGFELLARLSYRGFKLIFTTAHREYAIEAIKSKATDYLLKPIDYNEFRKCLTDISGTGEVVSVPHSRISHQFIDIATSEGIILLRQQEIVWVEASRSYTIFHLDGGRKQVASRSMKEYEAALDDAMFFRCHNSCIINLHKIERILTDSGWMAVMNDSSTVRVAKTHKSDLMARLKSV